MITEQLSGGRVGHPLEGLAARGEAARGDLGEKRAQIGVSVNRARAGRDHQTLERDQLIGPRRRRRRPPAAPSRARVGQERHARGDRDPASTTRPISDSSLTAPLRPASGAAASATRTAPPREVARGSGACCSAPPETARSASSPRAPWPGWPSAPAAGTRAAPPSASGDAMFTGSRCIARTRRSPPGADRSRASSAPIAAWTAARAALVSGGSARSSLSPKPQHARREHDAHDREQRPRKPGRDREPRPRLASGVAHGGRAPERRAPERLASEPGHGVHRSGPGHRGGDQRRAHGERHHDRHDLPDPWHLDSRWLAVGRVTLAPPPGQTTSTSAPSITTPVPNSTMNSAVVGACADPGVDRRRTRERCARRHRHDRHRRRQPQPRGRRPCPCARPLHTEKAPFRSVRPVREGPAAEAISASGHGLRRASSPPSAYRRGPGRILARHSRNRPQARRRGLDCWASDEARSGCGHGR